MRTLKFRGWSIDGGKWCSRVDYDGYKEKWTGIVEVNSLIEKDKYIGEYVADPEEIIIEQSTGLKDKNGKEIYEGDIVIVQSEEFYLFVLGIVGFDDKKGIYDFYVIKRGKIYWDSGCDQCSRMAREGYTTEVIGNIHEDHELLKGEE